MKIPRLDVALSDLTKAPALCTALFIPEDRASVKTAEKKLQLMFDGHAQSLSSQGFSGKDSEIIVLAPPSLHGKPLIVAGLGHTEEFSLERLRRAAALAARQAVRLRQESLLLSLPDYLLEPKFRVSEHHASMEDFGRAFLEGAALGIYRYDKYKKSDPSPLPLTLTLGLQDTIAVRKFRPVLHKTRSVIEGVWLARDLANAPGNEIYPETFAAVARATGRESGFAVKVYGQSKIRSLNMGGLIGVSQGSAKPPRFLVLEYGKRRRTGKPVVLVGKGVTFDSGGISIKPSANMAEMKMDMSGGATVLGTFRTVSRLKLPIHLVGLIPVTENLPGGRALKPGDVLRHLNGKTSEIDNTDAEGRLILADALSYASRYNPRAVIDVATLTGAVVIALGHFATGMLGNDRRLLSALHESGERTGERVWELPMFKEYERLLKSEIADVKNTGGRWAGAITGAMFLKQFIGNYPWVHLDIAGTAIIEETFGYIPKGGSGVGVRLLTDYLLHLSLHD
ncbi:MAG: leucyl aminopeptidase [Bacteroidota bacterium]